MRAPEKYHQGHRIRFVQPDARWLSQQYWEEGKSITQIAREQDTTSRTVWLWMIKADISRRTKKQRAERHSKRMAGAGNPAWNGGVSRNYQASILTERPQICEWCGTTEDIQVHHHDHDVTNGVPENLALLCGICNRLESHLWALQQSGRAQVEIDEANISISFTKTEV